jgi:undecaprenyl diphosphate synthase
MTASDTQPSLLPTHLGLILDGNRRWAVDQGLSQLEGHRKGYENLKHIGKAAIAQGIKYVSAYVFSTENWNRSREEVGYLLDLLFWVATNEVDEMHKENIRVRFVGSRERLSDKILKAIDRAETKTAGNTNGTMALCLNYGGQQEIADSVKAIVAAGTSAEDVTPDLIAEHLYAPDIPPVDLIIRTSGEQRISNFMLWRAAYSELIFVEKHWPGFTEVDLDDCLAEFASRQRRFGS